MWLAIEVGPGSEEPGPRARHRELPLVVANAAVNVAHSRDVAHLSNRCRVVWPGKHIADLGDYTFRLLARLVDFLTKCIAVLQASDVFAQVLLPVRIGNGKKHSITDVNTERIQIAVQEPAFSFV